MNKVYWGDCRESMRQMAKEGIKVQMCVTSPPYYGLRDYGTAEWVGGDSSCEHKGFVISNNRNFIDKGGSGSNKKAISSGDCLKCGATRKDLQIGNEKTPQQFIDNLVEVFACVWDILADDGTLWVNLGDSYSAGGRGGGQEGSIQQGNKGSTTGEVFGAWKVEGYRPKNLLGTPWKLAFALQEFGWNLRQDIIWSKPNPMPESVTDRCTKAHEYIFLLSKNQKYYFDYEAIKEEGVYPEGTKAAKGSVERQNQDGVNARPPEYKIYDGMRNKRSVWTVNTKAYKGAHFATYPEELIQPCILAGSRVGDIVLDPFFGSGTTGQVAQNLGRKWIGCELNKEYEVLQNERIAQQGLEFI